jgi:hypothetical protein
MDKTDRDTLLEIYERSGTSKPVFVALDPAENIFNDKERFMIYGRLRGTLGLSHTASIYFNSELSIEEAF